MCELLQFCSHSLTLGTPEGRETIRLKNPTTLFVMPLHSDISTILLKHALGTYVYISTISKGFVRQ